MAIEIFEDLTEGAREGPPMIRWLAGAIALGAVYLALLFVYALIRAPVQAAIITAVVVLPYAAGKLLAVCGEYRRD